jgi:hypothetical protein
MSFAIVRQAHRNLFAMRGQIYAPPGRAQQGGRDLRLDLFRGLALLFIFIDHVPDNVLSYLTLQSF